jgi:hypothetical protein
MKRSRQYLITILLFAAQVAYAQDILPELKPADFPDGKITRTEYFDGSSLWGYIDGGADIYMEYGFVKALVQEIQLHQHQFKIEIYQMKDEEAAFGIYSVSIHKCSEVDSLPKFNCLSQYQLQMTHGRSYISIVNNNGTLEEQVISQQIARMIIKKSKEKSFSLPLLFMHKVLIPYQKDLKFFKGKLGIQNGFPEWQDLFEDMENYALYFLPVDIKEGSIRIAQIQFLTESDKNLFYNKLKIVPRQKTSYWQTTDRGIIRGVKELTRLKINYIESDMKSDKFKTYKKIIQ